MGTKIPLFCETAKRVFEFLNLADLELSIFNFAPGNVRFRLYCRRTWVAFSNTSHNLIMPYLSTPWGCAKQRLYAAEKWGKNSIDNIRPPKELFWKNIWRFRKIAVFLQSKSGKKKYIDNIRPPMTAVSVASSVHPLPAVRKGLSGAETPFFGGYWEAQQTGVWGVLSPAGVWGQRPLLRTFGITPEDLPPTYITVELTGDIAP